MDVAASLQLPQILSVFSEEISCRSGQVIDVYVAPSFVQARSVLPRFAEARPDDRLQAGVALRAARGDIRVHPYLFRAVCCNGQIRVEAVQSRKLVGLEQLPVAQALDVLRQAVAGCCAEEAFSDAMERVRDGATAIVIEAIQMMARMARSQRHELVEIERRFQREGDLTRYGLANAVTSVARDTSDRRRRWDLEELGGAIAAGDFGPRPHLPPRAARPVSLEGGELLNRPTPQGILTRDPMRPPPAIADAVS